MQAWIIVALLIVALIVAAALSIWLSKRAEFWEEVEGPEDELSGSMEVKQTERGMVYTIWDKSNKDKRLVLTPDGTFLETREGDTWKRTVVMTEPIPGGDNDDP